MSNFIGKFILIFSGFVLSGCATPQFDISVREDGPTIRTITARIRCELTDLIREDGEFSTYRKLLLNGDYEVAVALSLQVSESGEVAPSLNFPYPPLFSFNAGVRLGRIRDQNFSQNLRFSMKQLRDRLDANERFGGCPENDTILAGDLGIRTTALLAFSTPDSDPKGKLNGAAGEFGGFANFVVTRSINATGPTWNLTHFRGPGNFGSLGRTDTHKVTFAFAQGDGKLRVGPTPTPRANQYLNQLQLNQINSLPPRN